MSKQIVWNIGGQLTQVNGYMDSILKALVAGHGDWAGMRNVVCADHKEASKVGFNWLKVRNALEGLRSAGVLARTSSVHSEEYALCMTAERCE